ncbi:MAG: hypothetical protein HY820_10030 [Acidobacteria bacterium]|nr:hypothetical protein [Acidobacteriota bacterium]
MKFRNLILTAMGALLLVALGVNAKTTFLYATGTLVPLPGLEEGVVNCQGAVQPALNIFDPCPGVRGTIRGRIAKGLMVSAEPRLNGPISIVSNINFGPDRKGNMWGTFELSSGGGVIEGSYTGDIDLSTLAISYKMVGHGRGGTVDGLQLKVEGHPTTPPLSDWAARILDPGQD